VRTIGAFASLLLLLLGGSAHATQIQFLWKATGTDSITVVPGQEVVLQVQVQAGTPGLQGVSVAALAPLDLLEAVAFAVCPAADGNLFAGACGLESGNTLTPAGLTNVVLNQQNGGSPGGVFDPTPIPGLSGSFAALQNPSLPGVSDATFVLAELTFRVLGLGSGEVLPYYRAGIDGAVDVGSTFFVPLADGADFTSGASLQVVPEPGTFSLLALGLGLLARRRR
jgi:hypothetical protein